jgi:thymidylate synthase
MKTAKEWAEYLPLDIKLWFIEECESEGSKLNNLYDSLLECVWQEFDWANKYCDSLGAPKRAISLMWNQRSVDTFLGLPFNIASYGLLLEIIAKAVNMVPDELIGNLGDVHLYSNHVEQAKEQITREPYPLPTLKINSGNENWHLLDIDEIINSLDVDITFKVDNYQSHPTIKAPLSN